MDSGTVEGYNKLLIFSDNRKINIYYTLTTANGSESSFRWRRRRKNIKRRFIFKASPISRIFYTLRRMDVPHAAKRPKEHTAFRSCNKLQRGTPLYDMYYISYKNSDRYPHVKMFASEDGASGEHIIKTTEQDCSNL